MSGTVLEFQSIHDTFRPKILRYLTQLVGEEEAEDLTQTVMVKVNEGLRNFRGDSTLSTWIYRIATNTALDKLRSPAMRWTAGQLHLAEIQSERGGCSGERNIAPRRANSIGRGDGYSQRDDRMSPRVPGPPSRNIQTRNGAERTAGIQKQRDCRDPRYQPQYRQDSLAPRPRETPQRAGNRMQFLSRRAK